MQLLLSTGNGDADPVSSSGDTVVEFSMTADVASTSAVFDVLTITPASDGLPWHDYGDVSRWMMVGRVEVEGHQETVECHGTTTIVVNRCK